MNYVIATSKDWNAKIAKRLQQATGANSYIVRSREDLTVKKLKEMNPQHVFFPHWSDIISPEIFENFECIMFHMTDLPFGRGGSPLQNLISREIYETKITAFKCTAELDAGPVYLKRPLSLYGSAEEIFIRASGVIETMIQEIIEKKIKPTPQAGESVCFKRRTPSQSEIPADGNLQKVFDYIRMLDAEGYPNAFIKAGKIKVNFSRAQLKNGYIIADARISIGEGNSNV